MKFRDLSEEAQNIFLERLRIQRPFEDTDVTDELYNIADIYVIGYTGENLFLRDVQRYIAGSHAHISTRQARGILNVMLIGLRNAMERQKAAKKQSTPQAIKELRANCRAQEERVRLFPVDGKPHTWRTRSKSDPKVHYDVCYHPSFGTADCSCKGYATQRCCKHSAALLRKIARETVRTQRKDANS